MYTFVAFCCLGHALWLPLRGHVPPGLVALRQLSLHVVPRPADAGRDAGARLRGDRQSRGHLFLEPSHAVDVPTSLWDQTEPVSRGVALILVSYP